MHERRVRARPPLGGSALAHSPRLARSAVAGFGPVCDLESAYTLGAGEGAVEAFLGGAPCEVPCRSAAASPFTLLPLGVRQLVIHGADDDVLPISPSRAHAETARALGTPVDCLELPDVGHMNFLDPSSDACGHVCRWLERPRP